MGFVFGWVRGEMVPEFEVVVVAIGGSWLLVGVLG